MCLSLLATTIAIFSSDLESHQFLYFVLCQFFDSGTMIYQMVYHFFVEDLYGFRQMSCNDTWQGQLPFFFRECFFYFLRGFQRQGLHFTIVILGKHFVLDVDVGLDEAEEVVLLASEFDHVFILLLFPYVGIDQKQCPNIVFTLVMPPDDIGNISVSFKLIQFHFIVLINYNKIYCSMFFNFIY